MGYRFLPFTAAYFITGVISVLVARSAWRRREAPGGSSLALMLLAIAQWAFIYALEVSAVSVETKVFWSKVAYLGIVSAPPLLFTFAVDYTQRYRWLTQRNRVLLWIIPAITFVLTLTNEWHNLVWSGFIPNPETNIMVYEHGLWFWISLSYIYALVLLASLLLLWAAFHFRNIYRRQALILMLCIPLPWIGSVLYVSEFDPIKGLDTTVITFAVIGIVLTWAIRRHQLFNLSPVARDRVIESMSDSLLVLDMQHRIVDINPAARLLLEHLQAADQRAEEFQYIGQSIEHIFAPWPHLIQGLCMETKTHIDVELEVRGQSRFFDLDISPLSSSRGTFTGSVVVIHDISERKRIEDAENKARRLAESLHEAGIAISSTLDFDQVVDLILSRISQILTFDWASVFLLQRDELVLAGSLGIDNPDVTLETRTPVSEAYPYHLALSRRRPVRVADVQAMFPSYRRPPLSEIRSWLGFPLIFQDQIIGLLTLDSKDYDHFTAADEKIASAFATQVAIAIENARLYSDAQRRIMEQSILNEIMQSISAELELNELLELVHRQINRFVDAQFFMIASHDHQAAKWQPVYLIDSKTGADFVRKYYPTGEGLTGYILQNCEPLLLNSDSEFMAFIEETGCVNIGPSPSALMGVPLVAEGKVIGVMVTQHYEQEHYFTQDDFTLFRLIGSQVAVALQNANLFARIKELARMDALTGLNNRRHFFYLAEQEVKRARRYDRKLAAMMLDIDHFKHVNDTYGHASGDKVLQAIAELSKRTLRKQDTIGRYGGEEFAVILPETDISRAMEVAERLRVAIASCPIDISQGTVDLTVSIGVAALDTDGNMAVESLLDRADKALYAAKREGRDCVKVFNELEAL